MIKPYVKFKFDNKITIIDITKKNINLQINRQLIIGKHGTISGYKPVSIISQDNAVSNKLI